MSEEGIRGCGGVLRGNRVFWVPMVFVVVVLMMMNISSGSQEVEVRVFEGNKDNVKVSITGRRATPEPTPPPPPPPDIPPQSAFSYKTFSADTDESCQEVMRLGMQNVPSIAIPDINKLRENYQQATAAAEHLRTCHTNEKKRHKMTKGTLGVSSPRRFWIDLGSRSMDVTKNFDLRYPGAATFMKHTFEPNPEFVHLYKGKANLEHHQVAVSVVNSTLQLSNADVGSSIVKNAAKNINGPSVTVNTINWVNWLVNTVRPSDFVVVKMDIEFCEFAVLNLLLQSSAITLIDELLLECHFKTRKSRKYIPAEGEEEPISRNDCKNLVHLIELSGVLAINWSKKNYHADLYAASHGGFQAT